MKGIFVLLLLALTVGCAPQPGPSSSPTPEKTLLERADEMMAAQDFEGAALAYRQLLDELEDSDADQAEQELVREKCVKAMVEAGGFVGSQRLWGEMAQKNPESKMEADRMKARAERMMIQQGEELLVQAAEDLKQGHRSKALATALASQSLFEGAGADQKHKESLTSVLDEIREVKTP